MSKYLTVLPSIYHVTLRPGLLSSVTREAISYFGSENQKLKLVEELGELQRAVTKDLMGFRDEENILEALADCYIMLDQYMRIHDFSAQALSDKIDKRLVRLQGRMEG